MGSKDTKEPETEHCANYDIMEFLSAHQIEDQWNWNM